MFLGKHQSLNHKGKLTWCLMCSANSCCDLMCLAVVGVRSILCCSPGPRLLFEQEEEEIGSMVVSCTPAGASGACACAGAGECGSRAAAAAAGILPGGRREHCIAPVQRVCSGGLAHCGGARD